MSGALGALVGLLACESAPLLRLLSARVIVVTLATRFIGGSAGLVAHQGVLKCGRGAPSVACLIVRLVDNVRVVERGAIALLQLSVAIDEAFCQPLEVRARTFLLWGLLYIVDAFVAIADCVVDRGLIAAYHGLRELDWGSQRKAWLVRRLSRA